MKNLEDTLLPRTLRHMLKLYILHARPSIHLRLRRCGLLLESFAPEQGIQLAYMRRLQNAAGDDRQEYTVLVQTTTASQRR